MKKSVSKNLSILALHSELGDRLLVPGTDEYERGRRVWNGMHDRRPILIARCLTASEVGTVVRYAVAAELGVTVRGGGHNVAGLAVADDTVMIDLSLMRGVVIDPGQKLAHAQGGCLLRDLDAATAVYGLACPAGVVSHTGLGGLALGGGYGWLADRWGLTCDHIVGAEVMLADGSTVDVTDSKHKDLMWALRGGGGGFGVVTRFTLRLRPVGPVRYQSAAYTLDNITGVLAAYRELAEEQFTEKQPTDLHAVCSVKYGSQSDWIPRRIKDEPLLFMSAAWFGGPDKGSLASEALFSSVQPAAESTRMMAYSELQALGDQGEPHGNRYFTKSCYLSDLAPEAVAELTRAAQEIPSRLSSIDFEYLCGAIMNVPDEESAFPHRDAPYICTASAQWNEASRDEENIIWARRSVDRLNAFHYGGVYVNYVQDQHDRAPLGIYDFQRYRRLSAIKDRYDPLNTFRCNQNIIPAGISMP